MLRAKMCPESQVRSHVLAAKYRAQMPLDELREARAMTPVHLAKVLHVNQAAVPKMERRTDMYVSMLKEFDRAMGGEIKITAEFPDGEVEISQVEAASKPSSCHAASGPCVPQARRSGTLEYPAMNSGVSFPQRPGPSYLLSSWLRSKSIGR